MISTTFLKTALSTTHLFLVLCDDSSSISFRLFTSTSIMAKHLTDISSVLGEYLRFWT